MPAIHALRHFEVSFDQRGQLDQLATGDGGLPAAVSTGEVDDLFVFVHGWNAGAASARATESAIFEILADQLDERRDRCAAVAVNWPSLLFPEDDPTTASPTPSSGAQLANALAPAFPRRAYQLDEIATLLDEQPPSMPELERFHVLAAALVTSPSLALEDSGGAAVLQPIPQACSVLQRLSVIGPRAGATTGWTPTPRSGPAAVRCCGC